MSAPRIGLIGARRRRQGLGPFVASELLAAGAEIPCLLGTRAESVEAARRDLAERCGIEARGYLELDELLAHEKLDALAVLSPWETHERYLEAALAAGLHVLCEKPLVWGGDAPSARVRRLVAEFARRGLILFENCQWPYALPAFDALHPAARRGPPRRFEMRLSPASPGWRMLPDSMPHPLSLLQALIPADDARLEAPRIHSSAAGAAADPREVRAIAAEFLYCAGAESVEVSVELVASDETPRRAGFGLNGCWAERLVRASDYALSFAGGSRWVDLPDPLRALVRAFTSELRGGKAPGTRARDIVARSEMLEALGRELERGSP